MNKNLPPLNSSVLLNCLKALTEWFSFHKRKLHFRENPTVYSTWISEVMLQQTTTQTVEPYFQRFMERFPCIESLAKASLEEVLELWSGLGYYSRAKNLYHCAQIIYANNQIFPQNKKELLKLPGIGEYTAGAILSFGYNLPYPIIDTNIARVIARMRGIASASAKKRLWRVAEILVQKAFNNGIAPRIFNGALMELGSLLCKADSVKCEICPLKLSCKTNLLSLDFTKIPFRRVKKENIKIKEDAFFLLERSKDGFYYLVVKDPTKKWMKTLWDLPLSLPFLKQKESSLVRRFTYSVTHHKIERTLHFLFLARIPIEFFKMETKRLKVDEITHKTPPLAASSALKKSINQLKNLDSLLEENKFSLH
jgi:A/G-specific adenine glycosylase